MQCTPTAKAGQGASDTDCGNWDKIGPVNGILASIRNMRNRPLFVYKRGPSVDSSKCYMGMLLTFLAESQDTGGDFSLIEGCLKPGNEPPPHVHDREDELFYVLEGRMDVYVGNEVFNAGAGECFRSYTSTFPGGLSIHRSGCVRLTMWVWSLYAHSVHQGALWFQRVLREIRGLAVTANIIERVFVSMDVHEHGKPQYQPRAIPGF